MIRATERGRADGGIVVRRSRKRWRCDGNGAGGAGLAHAPGCVLEILPGETYVECLWSAPAYASGSHHCYRCALAYFGGWVERDGAP